MSSVRSAAKVYADQLFSLGHGYPLWDPEPKYHEVAIGDVGWIDNFGAFYPLFNAVEDLEHERNREGVPDGHKRFPTPQWRPATGHIPAGVYHSKTVTRLQASAHVGGHGASGGFHYQCTDKRGAALVIKEAAYRTALHHSRRMSNYMKENLHKWLEFAEQKDVNLSQEDIYFVRGFVKARSWYVTAWMYEGQSGRLSISGDLGSAAQAKVDIDYGRDTERSPEHNWGPQGNINQDHPDQCVFLHYYKMKVRLGFWPVMKAAAEPRDPTPGRDSPEPGGSQAGTHGLGLYHIEQVPAREKVCNIMQWRTIDLFTLYQGE
ncbi:hypothetical protein WOLCODRAFT_75146 [Wolfiporia cocos MD-104 SS10]|uniref:Uncharacterized protein n=1 Tax=Wolfiporia cocos (strain MD-104) TaxID=742152 RepID=A0A2H3K141_WOLCO|nr:hypothetical protein WOLCODRAFT_75146 [Wolfiporia cocos MD-104 SS10]